MNNPDVHPSPLFNGGSTHFENLSPSMWNPIGSALVSAADLLPGELVIDLCAGAGSATIPAAQGVAPSGHVHAVDLSDELLSTAKEKASYLRLEQLIDFTVADARTFVPRQRPDVVLLGLALFLMPEPQKLLEHIHGYMKPGGRFLLSTWADPGLDPLLEPLLRVAKRHNEALASLSTPDSFMRLKRHASVETMKNKLRDAGFENIESSELALRIEFDHQLLWDFVLGTGAKSLLSSREQANERIRQELIEEVFGEEEIIEFDLSIYLHLATVPEIETSLEPEERQEDKGPRRAKNTSEG